MDFIRSGDDKNAMGAMLNPTAYERACVTAYGPVVRFAVSTVQYYKRERNSPCHTQVHSALS
ncbi:MAG: hypothetical protein ACM3PE_04075 [Deltaproteobacteria bacterium]